VLKIIITRGSGGRGYDPASVVTPTRLLLLHPWPEYPREYCESGVEVRLCETRLAGNPRLAGIKHLNRLEQVLARGEWRDPSIAEGLMLDAHDHVIEGTMSNLFLLRNGQLLTPDVSQSGVAGIIRGRILEAASDLGLKALVGEVECEDLYRADEVFLCNSVIGIWPVRALNNRRWNTMPVTHCVRQYLARHGIIAPG
jgi:4-amino-4-deoxychorismate lyase